MNLIFNDKMLDYHSPLSEHRTHIQQGYTWIIVCMIHPELEPLSSPFQSSLCNDHNPHQFLRL